MFINNPIDLLKFEHAIFRVRFSIIERLLNNCDNDAFYLLQETHEFIINWHAKIEDKYIFLFYGDAAKRFHSDHLLIEKYGNSIIKEKRKDWAERYIKIVLDHNNDEENILFNQNINVQSSWNNILEELKNYKDYSKYTGIRDL
ncbi:hemerythrin domain-containing protein [Acidianus manzaensis]|uniref:Cation-binding protein n=1 Tax=Acidianus manzaensis TaxID=282676 RepID=A0A1W6K2Z5_9CREN|nr:cation-binding protein [Acidianus manzaensis]ARM76898.1 cation-binding protein [Acidianus manzaensis]